MLENSLLWCLLGYLCGSIPFGLILSNLFGNGKLREEGSKNIGATNVLRTQGKSLGALTLLLDGLKSFVIVYLSPHPFVIFVMCCAILGHLFPVWLKFNGGKGIAAFLGGILALDPIIGAICVICWLCVYALFKISSVSGMAMCILGSVLLAVKTCMNQEAPCTCVVTILCICILIIIRHKDNIQRLLAHKENKI